METKPTYEVEGAERERERYKKYIEGYLQLYLRNQRADKTCVVFTGYWGKVIIAVQTYPSSWYFFWEEIEPLPVEVAMARSESDE